MIRFKLLSTILLLMASASALAEIQFAIGEPTPDSTKSGIGQISGWAVSDIPIVSIEAFIDGVSVGVVPYGGTRMDVAAAFPELPDSEFSGWAMKWNYSLLARGEHVVTIVVLDEDGTQESRNVVFNTTGFKSEFISDPGNIRTSGAATITPEDGRIVISGAEIEGEIVDIELRWDTAAQQFLISKVTGEEPATENQAPTADAGASRNVNAGEMVVVEGNGYDADGTVEAYSWTQITGPRVSLLNATTRIVRFTAPDETSTIRLRLTVTDNDGAGDQDDTVIEIVEPLPEPPPEPEPENQTPLANAGPNLTVQTGETVTIAGSGSDTDGTIATFNWVRVSGLMVTLQNADSATVSFTAPGSPGTIQLRLTVTDDEGATDIDDVIVTVEEVVGGDPTTGSTLESWLALINEARGQAQNCGGTEYPAQPPLQWSSSLADIARQHSMDMARNGYFGHTSQDGTPMGTRVFAYWNGSRVGENIAASSTNRSGIYIVELWMESSGHCALIMDPNFTHAGVSSGHNTENGYSFHHFWTLDFGG